MTYASSRANNPRHTGLASRIREELSRGPLTIRELAGCLQVDEKKVRTSVNQMAKKHGGLGPVPGDPHRAQRYATSAWLMENKPPEKTNIAAPITIRGYVF
jgi:hypothetical protein